MQDIGGAAGADEDTPDQHLTTIDLG